MDWLNGSGGCCLFRDRATGLADVSDDDLTCMGRTDALWELHIADVEGVAFAKVADVEFKGVWQIVRQADDFDCVNVLLKDTTGLHASRLTVEVGWDVSGDFGLLVDGEEVHVKHGTAEWVVLDGLEESEAGAFTFDIEVNQDVFRAAVSKDFAEGLRINLEVVAFNAASVDHGWEPAFAAHLFEASGAAAGAGCCFE